MNMIIKKSLQSLLLVPVIALGVSTVSPVLVDTASAVSSFDQGVKGGVGATGQNNTNTVTADSLVKQITNVLLFVVGAAAIIMIIWGGIKYVTSGGDSAGVTSAKNTILYAVIGLIVAVLAYTLVNFVFSDLLNGIAPANSV